MKRAEKKAQLRAKLVEVARQAFTESGYEGVTYRGLAELAGVSTGAFYANWKGKGDLFVEAMERPTPDVPAFLFRVQAQCSGMPGRLGEIAEEAGEIRRLLVGTGDCS